MPRNESSRNVESTLVLLAVFVAALIIGIISADQTNIATADSTQDTPFQVSSALH